LTSSPGQDVSGEYSPDGEHVVFSSDRSGSFQIWVASSDGSHPRQLTFMQSPITGTPHWSPDGRRIAFDSRPEGRGAVFVIDSQGGEPRQVTQDEFDDIVPNWSRDGKSLYFCSNRANAAQVFRIPASRGAAVQITKDGGFEAVESADRQWLYFSKPDGGGVWRMPLAGGQEERVLDLFVSRFWTVTPWGIGFLNLNAQPHPFFGVMNVATRKVKTLGTLRGGIAWGSSGLSVSPNGEWLLYAQVDGLVSQIFLVENFE
jgi:Tol biopolymer transport system component